MLRHAFVYTSYISSLKLFSLLEDIADDLSTVLLQEAVNHTFGRFGISKQIIILTEVNTE
ncbi:hypothetical protein BVG93_24215 [Serratia marcescens]|nr:hypothetical protein BVG93_24215 [Serratia marcescens]